MSRTLRTLRWPGGRATSFRYSPAEWRQIEAASMSEGLTWGDWARAELASPPTGVTQTRYLRRRATEILAAAALTAGRVSGAPGHQDAKHPMLAGRLVSLDAELLDNELVAMVIQERHDFGAFELVAGERTVSDAQGPVPVLIVRSKLEGDFSAMMWRDPPADQEPDTFDVEAFDEPL